MAGAILFNELFMLYDGTRTYCILQYAMVLSIYKNLLEHESRQNIQTTKALVRNYSKFWHPLD